MKKIGEKSGMIVETLCCSDCGEGENFYFASVD